MRKTLLAVLVGASVFGLPALAQVRLGGAGHVGGSVASGASHGAMRAPDPLGAPAAPDLPQTRHHVSHATGRAAGRAHSPLPPHPNTDAEAGSSAHVDAGHTHAQANADVDAGARVDAAAAADRASGTARGVGDGVSDTAHSAVGATDRTAGSVSDAVRPVATGRSVGADAKVRAKADAHGH